MSVFDDLNIGQLVHRMLGRLSKLVQLLSASPVYYPWQIIPPDGKAFDYVATIALPVSGGGVAPNPGVETVVVSFMCPLGYDGIIKRISNNYLGPSFDPGVPSLIWRIRSGSSIANSKFVDNYSNIVVEYGTTNFPRETDGIFVTSGQTMLYTVTNQDPGLPAGNSQVTCCFAGLFWPQQRDREREKNMKEAESGK